MSVDYASLLSDYDDKGVCGLPEEIDPSDKLEEKISLLCEMLTSLQHVVVHTGAGISTAAGIPDFRGPKGVWTLEKQGRKVETDVTFEDARPTLAHMALVGLVQAGVVKYVVSQNVDGLHLKSGLPRSQLSELHGNMFMEKCEKCGSDVLASFPGLAQLSIACSTEKQFALGESLGMRLVMCPYLGFGGRLKAWEYVREKVVQTVGLKRTGNQCSGGGSRGRCRGKLRDTVLDWEDDLPAVDLERADYHSRKADLSLCLGTTMQIVPAGKLPLLAKKNSGKLVICNLQPTRYDKQADLVIHGYVDDVLCAVMKKLKIPIPDIETRPGKTGNETRSSKSETPRQSGSVVNETPSSKTEVQSSNAETERQPCKTEIKAQPSTTAQPTKAETERQSSKTKTQLSNADTEIGMHYTVTGLRNN